MYVLFLLMDGRCSSYVTVAIVGAAFHLLHLQRADDDMPIRGGHTTNTVILSVYHEL